MEADELRLVRMGLLPDPDGVNMMALAGQVHTAGDELLPLVWDMAQELAARVARRIVQLEAGVRELAYQYPLSELHQRMARHLVNFPEPLPDPDWPGRTIP